MSEMFPTVHNVPASQVHQLSEEEYLLGEAIPEPDPESMLFTEDDELPPASDDILSTQPINWRAAVEVPIVVPEADSELQDLLGRLRAVLIAYGVWDTRDDLDYNRGVVGAERAYFIAAWTDRVLAQLELDEDEES